MNKQIKQLAGDEINKFITLVKNKKDKKLAANELILLQPHIYADYRSKMKEFAAKRCFSQKKIHEQVEENYLFKNQGPFQRQPKKPKTKVDNCPSYYYAKQNQIMSLKQFIILVQQAKRKSQIQERFNTRVREKQFVKQIGRQIQSSHSQRNLRLTSSSAHRIKKRINQIKYSQFQV